MQKAAMTIKLCHHYLARNTWMPWILEMSQIMILYLHGVPQERRITLNPLRGKTEFLAKETVKVNPQRGKTRRNP